MRRSFKFRLYPNVNQERELTIALETHRRLYNATLAERKTAWKEEQRPVKWTDQVKRFKDAQHSGHTFYSKLNNHSGNDTIRRVDRAFQAFFRRVKAGQKPGYPRFRGHDRYDSMSYGTYPNGCKLIEDRLRVQHVGKIKTKVHRPVEGKIKTATLKREADKWYVVLSCDLGDVTVTPSVNPPVGIDVGLKAFLTTSEGEQFPNPRYLKTALPELRRKGRSVSRKKRGGKNRRKAVKQLAKVYTRVKNLRKEHHWQVANSLVRRYGTIAVESLNIRGMLGNDRLARSISDVAWGNFMLTLKSKAESAGVSVVNVNPRGTTQQCSGCGAMPDVPKTLRDRWHTCLACGLSLDRDENAARNILARGLPARIGPVGVNGQRAVAEEILQLPPVALVIEEFEG